MQVANYLLSRFIGNSMTQTFPDGCLTIVSPNQKNKNSSYLGAKNKTVLHAVLKSNNQTGGSLRASTPHGCLVQPFYQSKDALNLTLLYEHLGTARAGIITDIQMGAMRIKVEKNIPDRRSKQLGLTVCTHNNITC